jgi:DNA-binding NarL/FixJ family response regulator
MRIMLVDDHPGFRKVVMALLQLPGAEFLECEDGLKALREYPRFRPDVVLMDIEMKGLDGLNATIQITTAFPGARVFMLTQYDDPDLRLAAEKAGAAGYFLKDDLQQMQNLVRSLPFDARANSS